MSSGESLLSSPNDIFSLFANSIKSIKPPVKPPIMEVTVAVARGLYSYSDINILALNPIKINYILKINVIHMVIPHLHEVLQLFSTPFSP